MAPVRARAAALLLLFLYGFFAVADTIQPKNSSLSNASSSDVASLSVVNDSSDSNEYGDCFDPAAPHRGLFPAREQDCLNAAEEIFDFRDPFLPTTFARRSNVGFRLPKVVRNGTCVISIDVMNDADKDKFKPWLVYTTAMDIAHRCTHGYFHVGGRTTVGPKKVVDVLVFGRVIEPATASGESSLLNKTSLSSTEPSVTSPDRTLDLNTPDLGGGLECSDPPLPRERAWMISFKDCEIATNAIFGDRARDQRYTFSRETLATKYYYPLPATFRYRSCVVLLDMNNDSDQDTVRLSIVEATAWVLAHKCSGEERSVDQYGGRATVGVGTKDLINIWVYGRPIGGTNESSLVLAQPAPLIDSE
ncbi:MAG: hypothetical protein Q9161_008855 [Pseudevernia consocians]